MSDPNSEKVQLEKALLELEFIFDAPPTSQEGVRAEELVSLIERLEENVWNDTTDLK